MPWEGAENAGAAGRLLPNPEARLADDDGNGLPMYNVSPSTRCLIR